MKLSLWTICWELESRGMVLEPSIAEGLPSITAFRQSGERSYSAAHAEIVPSALISGAGAADVALSCDMDYLIIRQETPERVMNCLSEIFARYTAWENALYAHMVEGASLQTLLDTAHQIFQRPMFIKNDSSWTFAITRGYPADVHPYWAKMERNVGKRVQDYDVVRAVSTDPEFGTVFLEKYPTIIRSPAYGGMILHANLFQGERRVAEIIALENGTSFHRGEVHLMHAFAELLEKYIQANREILITVSDPGTFLSALLDKGKADEELLPVLYQALGLSPVVELCVAVTESRDRADTPMLAVLRDRIDKELDHAAAFSYRRQVVCVLGLGSWRTYPEALKQLEALIPGDAFRWSVSYEFSDLRNLPARYRQACTILAEAVREGKRHASTYELACACIARNCAGDPETRLLIHPDLLRLRAVDRRDRSHYGRTLMEYLLCGGNYTDTAARMGLHRNSLIYRMNKIRAIMRTNPDDLENRKLLIISYLLAGEPDDSGAPGQ